MLGQTYSVFGIPVAGPTEVAQYVMSSIYFQGPGNNDPTYVHDTEIPASTKQAMGPNADPADVAAAIAAAQAQYLQTYNQATSNFDASTTSLTPSLTDLTS